MPSITLDVWYSEKAILYYLTKISVVIKHRIWLWNCNFNMEMTIEISILKMHLKTWSKTLKKLCFKNPLS